MESSTKNLTLISSDAVEFELPVAAAALSEYVLNACGRGTDDDENEPEPEGDFQPVDVLRVSSGALKKVVDFLKHYKEEPMKNIPTPLGASTFNEVSHIFRILYIHLILDQACNILIIILIIILTLVQVMDQKWYQTFTSEKNMPRELLFEVLTAANYMTIKPLLDLCCLKVTFQLTNKSAEEVNI